MDLGWQRVGPWVTNWVTTGVTTGLNTAGHGWTRTDVMLALTCGFGLTVTRITCLREKGRRFKSCHPDTSGLSLSAESTDGDVPLFASGPGAQTPHAVLAPPEPPPRADGREPA